MFPLLSRDIKVRKLSLISKTVAPPPTRKLTCANRRNHLISNSKLYQASVIILTSSVQRFSLIVNKLILTIVISLLISHSVQAERQNSMLEDTRLLSAAVDIQLSEDQQIAFQTHLSEYLEKLGSATRKLIRRNNETDVAKKVVRKRKQLTRTLDKKMAGVLTEDQYPRYEKYRTLLLAKLSGALDAQGKEGTTSFTTMMGSSNSGT